MGKVFFDPGIESVSGILMGTDPYYLRRYPARDGGVMHKMLLATHRTAATTSNKCNRIYLRTPVKRTSPLTQREHQIRNRFIGVAAMIQEDHDRPADLHRSEERAERRKDHETVVLARLRRGVGSGSRLIAQPLPKRRGFFIPKPSNKAQPKPAPLVPNP